MFLVGGTNVGGKVVDLNTELIRVLDRVGSLLQESGEQLDWGDILLELYRDRDSETARAAVISKALEDLEIDRDDLNQRLEELQDYLVKVQDRMEPLLLRLGTPGSLLNKELEFTETSAPMAVGQAAFLIGADLRAQLEINSYSGEVLPADWDGALAPDQALQEIAIGGGLALRGSVSGSWGALAAEASASGGGAGRARIYHRYHADTTRIAALAVASRQWAAPWDLEGLFRELTKPGESGFESVVLNGKRHFDLAGELGIGYGLSFEREVATPDGSEMLEVEAGAKGGVTVTFRREADFKISAEKDHDGAVLVRLTSTSASDRSASLQLDASLRIDGLDAIGQSYTKAFFRDPEKLLAKLDKWTRPGDLLLEAMSNYDWSDPLFEDIGRLLIGAQGADDLASAAAARLRVMIDKEMAEHLPFWGVSSQELSRSLIARVARRLDLSEKLAERLREVIEDKLAESIDEAKGDLNQHVESLLDKTEDLVEEWLDPLEAVGIAVGELREQADATAQQLLQPVIDFLKRYEQIRLKVLEAVAQSARIQIGVSLGASKSRSMSESTLLSFRIRRPNAMTRRVHRAFVLGQASQAWGDFEAAREAGDIEVLEGVFQSLARSEGKLAFSMHFGDFGRIQRYRAKAEEVHLSVDSAGKILVAKARLTQQAVAEAFYVERSVGVIGSYDLVAALRDPQQIPPPLSFSIAYEDEQLRHRELRQFLRSLEDDRLGRPLLAPGAADKALAAYSSILTETGVSRAAGRIDLAFPVSIDHLEALVAIESSIGAEGIRRHAVLVQLRLTIPNSRYQSLLDGLAASHKGGVSPVDFVLEVYRLGSRDALNLMSKLVPSGAPTGPRSQLSRLFDLIERIGRSADDLVRVVEGIGKIASLQDEIRDFDTDPTDKVRRSLARRLHAATRQINNGLDSWLEVRSIFSGIFTEAIPSQTIAFLALLAELSPDHQELMPIVRIEGLKNGTILVA